MRTTSSSSSSQSCFRKYDSGAIGSLNHIIALHGITYSNEIDVVADGYQMRLVDLYNEPKLFVRYGRTIRRGSKT